MLGLTLVIAIVLFHFVEADKKQKVAPITTTDKKDKIK
jgi:hypothetical protein